MPPQDALISELKAQLRSFFPQGNSCRRLDCFHRQSERERNQGILFAAHCVAALSGILLAFYLSQVLSLRLTTDALSIRAMSVGFRAFSPGHQLHPLKREICHESTQTTVLSRPSSCAIHRSTTPCSTRRSLDRSCPSSPSTALMKPCRS